MIFWTVAKEDIGTPAENGMGSLNPGTMLMEEKTNININILSRFQKDIYRYSTRSWQWGNQQVSKYLCA